MTSEATWKTVSGYIAGDELHRENMTIDQAKLKCKELEGCSGFYYSGGPDASSDEAINIIFCSGAEVQEAIFTTYTTFLLTEAWEVWDRVEYKKNGARATVLHVYPNGNGEICYDANTVVMARARNDFKIVGKVAFHGADAVEKASHGTKDDFKDVTEQVRALLSDNQPLVKLPDAAFSPPQSTWPTFSAIAGVLLPFEEEKVLWIKLKAIDVLAKEDQSDPNLKQLLEVARSLAKRMESMDQAQDVEGKNS